MATALMALGASLLVAGCFARIGRRYGIPTIPLFMVAGIIFGPSTPGLDLVHDTADLELLAAIGLVFLLFYLGLEFSLTDLTEGGTRLITAGAIYLALNVGVGLGFGFALGWGEREALVLAGVVGISSSAIVTKLLVELKRLANPETRLILGVVVVEDLFLALYLAILQPVLDNTHGLTDILASIGTAFAVLIVLAAIARNGTRIVARVLNTDDNELLTICFVGFAILIAGVAEELGVSDAIGAFMAGLILAGTRHRARIQQLVLPLRDTFAAIFFFAFGVSIDPAAMVTVAGPIAVAVTITIALNIAAGIITARMYHLTRHAAANVGLTVLARGEFALILASYAAASGLDTRITPFVAGYVLVLALSAPLLAAHSEFLARMIPAHWTRPPRRSPSDRS